MLPTLAGCGSIDVRQLTRIYEPASRDKRKGVPARTALDAVDLSIPPGEVHGLLGPNGAGKTTLCKVLSTVLLPTSGTALVHGYDVVTRAKDVRPLIGLVFGGERGLYTRLTARRNLLYWAALYGVAGGTAAARVDELLHRVGLAGRADERVETFSRGMKQRLHLARGLIGDPRVVILDEPTTGLDPVAAHEFRALVRQLRDEGRTVLLTTHDMNEAEAVCDRVTLIDGGRLLRTEDPRAIGRWLSEYERVEATGVPPDTVEELRGLAGVSTVESIADGGGGGVRVRTDGPDTTRAVLRVLIDAGVSTVTTKPPSLEEVYLHLIGGRGLAV